MKIEDIKIGQILRVKELMTEKGREQYDLQPGTIIVVKSLFLNGIRSVVNGNEYLITPPALDKLELAE